MWNVGICQYLGKSNGTDGFDLPPRLLNDNYEYPPTEMIQAFEQGRVLGYEAFAFEWTIAESEAALETAPKAKFTTKFRLYVTRDKPNVGQYYGIDNPNEPGNGYYNIHETSIHHACVSAHQLSTKDEIVGTIFTKYFKDLKAKDIKGDPLTYWGKGEDSYCTNLEDFFKYNDGTCGTWARYMKEILRIHNIDADEVDIGVVNPAINLIEEEKITKKMTQIMLNAGISGVISTGKTSFMVKEWEDKANGECYELGDEYIYASGVVGIPAQNKDDPCSIFRNHVVLQYTTANEKQLFFDPSYGVAKAQLNDYENAAIKVVRGVLCSITYTDLSTGNYIISYYIYISKNNTNNTTELKYTVE
ncbi:MAG: hypothetical protein IPL35_13205 [Sphingobacteriales bacterium]|nr:hypothetical protein [Sphingobacteriales bacterium]